MPNTNLPDTNLSLHRVALLVASLDRETADQLLDQLPEATAEEVRRAVLELGCIDPSEQHQVIREFIQGDALPAQRREAAAPARIGFGGPTPTELPGRSTTRAVRDRVAEAGEGPLDRASERLIAECLGGELPQAIAVALAQLPTRRASEVVSHLPAPLQTQVLERLVEFDPASSLEFPDIREEFHQWLLQQIERSLHRAELAARLATILDATHSGTRQRILHNVSNSDARLAKELQHQLDAIQTTLALR